MRTGKGLGGGVWPIAALIATEELNGVCSTKALVTTTASLESFQTTQLASTQSVAHAERLTSLRPLLTPTALCLRGITPTRRTQWAALPGWRRSTTCSMRA